MKYPLIQWAKLRPGIIPVFFLSFSLGISGQIYLPDARSISLGNIECISGFNEYPNNNPGILGICDMKSLSIGHAMPFLIKEIGISSIEILMPVFSGAIQFRTYTYGLNGFRNFDYNLAYGIKITEDISIGVSYNYHHSIAAGEWNYLWNLGLGAGFHYKISESTKLAICIQNPISLGSYSDYGPVSPAKSSLAFSHIIYENTCILIEFSNNSHGSLRLNTGLEYKIQETLILRCGYHSNPNSFSTGIGLSSGKFNFDFAFSYTPLPGIYPALKLTFNPK